MSYCEYIQSDRAREPHISYHDLEYGFPIEEDTALFERLILEINQAGLSWETILNKRSGFRAAYSGFDIAQVAAYSEADTRRIMGRRSAEIAALLGFRGSEELIHRDDMVILRQEPTT